MIYDVVDEDKINYGKLKPHVKEAWLAALRSGEYEQGYGYLRDSDNRFCCLGVLCDLGKRAHERWKKKGRYQTYTYGNLKGGDEGCPPEIVRKRAGLSRVAMNRLMSMNDGEDEFIINNHKMVDLKESYNSFEEIADWIEENL